VRDRSADNSGPGAGLHDLAGLLERVNVTLAKNGVVGKAFVELF